MTAFIIGNGKSRLSFNLSELSSHGKIYGCNALYRDYIPDVLVSVDPPITEEISLNNIPEQTQHYARKPLHEKSMTITEELHRGFSSGPIACKIASKQKCSKIFLIGFDFISETTNINNVYAGTHGYRSADTEPTFYGNWVTQFKKVFDFHKEIMYYRIITNSMFIPNDWKGISNIENISTETFYKMLNSI
ncbi:MAG: hypothetical protein ACKVJK_19190 [Methylophagaceae bacterium]|tara:strand:- start:147 stop:719 length:573 start_codon:yes stop_codon:yes gene_type:complete